MQANGAGALVKASLEQGRKAGDALASLVRSIKVETGKMNVELSCEEGGTVEAELDIGATIQANASRFYEHRAKLLAKEVKTQAAAKEALKRAQHSAASEIKAQKIAQRKKVTAAARKAMWFEKFYWFLSSENFLVISARDAQQNEVLIKKYLRPKDLVFHAQIQGAAFTIVRNETQDPVPFVTINEAAAAAMAHSRAWDLKVAVEVFYVEASQVSKSAPTGLSLPTGSFMIYGRKNFVTLSRLEMGFGLLWRVDEEAAKRHAGERSVRVANDQALRVIPHEAVDKAPPEGELIDTNLAPDKKLTQKQKQAEAAAAKAAEAPKEEVEPDKAEKVLPLKGKEKKKEKAKAKPKEKLKEKEKEKPKKDEKGKKDDEKPEKAEAQKLSKPKKKEIEKLKKYAEKFGDETQEEAELRMKMLGYQKSSAFDRVKEISGFRKAPEDQNQPEEGAAAPSEAQPSENPDEAKEPQDEREPKQAKKGGKKPVVQEEALEEEAEEEEAEDYANLIGAPTPEDAVFDAIPVCAPYTALSSYRFKVKLQPGNLKKGKIAKTAIGLFLAQPEVSEREKELLRVLPENVSIMQALGNCRLQAAGVQKAKAAAKNAKKKKS